MLYFTSRFVLIILFINVDCSSEVKDNLTNEISSIYFDIEEFQKSLSDDGNPPSKESLVKIVKDLSSTLILMISHLESSKSFESSLITKMQNLQSEMEELRKDVNETEINLRRDVNEAEINLRKDVTEAEKNLRKDVTEAEINLRKDVAEAEINLRKDVNETECSMKTRIIDIENDVSKLKKESETNSSIETKDKGKITLSKKDFFVTPSLPYKQSKMYCLEQGGAPFVPKAKVDVYFIAEKVANTYYYYYDYWLPLTDSLEEGIAKWDDGTSYAKGPILFEPHPDKNNDYKDCVCIGREGNVDYNSTRLNVHYSYCYVPKRMLCITTQ